MWAININCKQKLCYGYCVIMTIVFRVHLTGLLLLSYAALFDSMSVQKLTVNSSKLMIETKSSTMPEISLDGANGVGILYSRGAGSARRYNNTLYLHNVLRRDVNPPAANMPKLGWSSNLARLAELWSRHCTMGYGLPLTLDPLTYSGQILQNIWSGGRNGTIEDALSSWLKEGNGYNFKTRACYRADGCKNYLTIVSASVHEVGCGLSYCNDDVIVVCYYGARNYKSHQSPYTAGKPCSQCGAFDWCDSGLCRSPGNKMKGDSVGTNCIYEKMDHVSINGGNSTAVSLEDGSHLKRQRRHTTEDAQEDCNKLYLPLLICIGFLIGIVGFGLLIGIVYMLAHICKDWCTCCSDCTSDGCCMGCFTREGSRCYRCCRSRCCKRVCRLIKCCKKVSVEPQEDLERTSTTESIPGGSESPVPDPVHAATQVDAVEYREMCTNTEPEPTTIARSTCIEHDLLDTNDAGTSVDLDCVDAEVQTDEIKEEPVDEIKEEPVDKKEEPVEKKEEEEKGQDQTDMGGTIDANSDHSDHPSDHSDYGDKQTDQTDSSRSVCLVHNCQTCDLHKRDQRLVDKLRTKNIRKLIRASSNKNLAPGTYIL